MPTQLARGWSPLTSVRIDSAPTYAASTKKLQAIICCAATLGSRGLET